MIHLRLKISNRHHPVDGLGNLYVVKLVLLNRIFDLGETLTNINGATGVTQERSL